MIFTCSIYSLWEKKHLTCWGTKKTHYGITKNIRQRRLHEGSPHSDGATNCMRSPQVICDGTASMQIIRLRDTPFSREVISLRRNKSSLVGCAIQRTGGKLSNGIVTCSCRCAKFPWRSQPWDFQKRTECVFFHFCGSQWPVSALSMQNLPSLGLLDLHIQQSLKKI